MIATAGQGQTNAKLLVISHSAVVSGYRERFAEIVRQGGPEITLLAPKRWRQFNAEVSLGSTSGLNYRVIPRQPVSWGLKNHGLRNVTHIHRGLRRLIRDLRPDIVEIWAEPFAAVTAQAVRGVSRFFPPARIIFFSAQNIRRNYPPPFSFFERYTYRHADFAFPINSETEKILREKGWRKQSLVLPMGINPDHFRKTDSPLLRRRLGLTGFTVGFLGKFDSQKGIPDLIRAVSQLSGECKLLLVGQGPLKSRLLRLAGELGVREKIRIIDPVGYDQLPAYLNCMNVLALPSITLPGLKEQFGRVLVEAMSCGVPVIGSDSGEIPNVVGDGGLIFPEGDVEALRDRIVGLRENPETAAELGRKGRQRVEREFTWETIARRQIEVYNQLLER